MVLVMMKKELDEDMLREQSNNPNWRVGKYEKPQRSKDPVASSADEHP